MAKSSITFEKANKGNFRHNDRSENEPSYLLPKEYRLGNECDVSSEVAESFLKELLNEASENYKKHFGQKLQAKKYVWEAVVTLNAEHTLEDVQKLVDEICKDSGMTSLQVSIHRDEGHINKRGYPVYNFHAHLSFFTLDRNTGQQLYRKHLTKKQKEKQPDLRPMNPKRMSQYQDMAAEILGMTRGIKGSGKKHIKPALFREIAELKSQVEELEDEYEIELDMDEAGIVFGKRGKHQDVIALEKTHENELKTLQNDLDVQIDQNQVKSSKIANFERLIDFFREREGFETIEQLVSWVNERIETKNEATNNNQPTINL